MTVSSQGLGKWEQAKQSHRDRGQPFQSLTWNVSSASFTRTIKGRMNTDAIQEETHENKAFFLLGRLTAQAYTSLLRRKPY